tara:strand:+ start:47 stop:397 length:351 start_codon:yes stop_codon:yes gene_type:complete
MKTLIATIAILFTVVTAASASQREPLGNCMIGAFVQNLAISSDLDEETIFTFLGSPEGAPQLQQLIDGTTQKVHFVVRAKLTGEPLSYVLDTLKTVDPVFNALESACIIDYYGEAV